MRLSLTQRRFDFADERISPSKISCCREEKGTTPMNAKLQTKICA
jgi:hypothetical protein